MKRNWKQITLGAAMLFACAAIIIAPLTGCNSTLQKKAVTTLEALGSGVNSAYDAYITEVVKGDVATNDVPTITAYYRDFQASFGVAAAAAHFATNTTLADAELLSLANKVTTAISVITKK